MSHFDPKTGLVVFDSQNASILDNGGAIINSPPTSKASEIIPTQKKNFYSWNANKISFGDYGLRTTNINESITYTLSEIVSPSDNINGVDLLDGSISISLIRQFGAFQMSAFKEFNPASIECGFCFAKQFSEFGNSGFDHYLTPTQMWTGNIELLSGVGELHNTAEGGFMYTSGSSKLMKSYSVPNGYGLFAYVGLSNVYPFNINVYPARGFATYQL